MLMFGFLISWIINEKCLHHDNEFIDANKEYSSVISFFVTLLLQH